MWSDVSPVARSWAFDFTLRSGNKDIEVSHPNAIAFHPEVPFLTVYDKTEIYDLPVDKIARVGWMPSSVLPV